jgi:F-type H+-transporting ATPase subunit b
MKFNIWTLLFQLINFTVLLFILKRLLYRPVREIMEKRRRLIEKTIEEAEASKRAAEELRTKNLKELEKLKETHLRMSEDMEAEVAEERKRLLSDAKNQADRLIEKEKALFDMEKKRATAEMKEMAMDTVSLFAANLFRDISDEEVHTSILRRLLSEIGQVISEIKAMEIKDETLRLEIISAYPVKGDEGEELKKALETGLGKRVTLASTVDRELIAGVKINAYGMIYDLSVSGQIEAFRIKAKENI